MLISQFYPLCVIDYLSFNLAQLVLKFKKWVVLIILITVVSGTLTVLFYLSCLKS